MFMPLCLAYVGIVYADLVKQLLIRQLFSMKTYIKHHLCTLTLTVTHSPARTKSSISIKVIRSFIGEH